ncbi:MAG: cupin domain-containing protein [Candidatus Latescibacteria bacterium]|nr:cupin domain-containing protein [Candidatus Latescibacterota bacterium]NIM21651.1 cupin domain-containing protein [Candidatus Latescibacterota bacterium]NIM64630.1 cupin domain-containing protein [Candidatus Latescibacterota bacterium]NIO01145.1 cupin domain-containing protein [Candidatus Latescibacterota bacterium]NIO27538.1 cupin domain-containing protein [Candidatus Latescibacterota bacterium]
MPNKKELGERIKRFRLERNLTLKDVELKAKVSATHVSEIERGMTSPTVGALSKIAKALGSEPSYFLSSNSLPPVSMVRKDNRKVLSYRDWGAKINCLSRGIRSSTMSFLELELEPGIQNDLEPLTHTGEEFMHILKGVVEIYVGLERHRLKEGDSIHFKSHEPHTIRNIGDAQAKLLWVALPPFHL